MAISEWQILFNTIKHDIGSPFGVIKEVFFYDYSPIKQFLEYKRDDFIGFVETFIGPSESLFFIYENEPNATFNLKNYLLVLAKIHCNPTSDLLLRKQARRTKHRYKRDKIPKCKKS
ncbi:hypothetical protein FNE33_03245 [Helicobacter pylori]|nr:hypothetical protein FNE33_03245 [Helicobacter pylori]